MIGIAILSAAGYLVLAAAGDLREQPRLYLSVHAFLFALYLAALVREARSASAQPVRAGGGRAAGVILGALAFRLILLPAEPSLSDDIHRYVWEGGLQLEAINPYRHVPADPHLAAYRDEIWEGINNKDLPAIYPPLMQWVFALGALCGRSLIAMKALFVAADMGLVVLLTALARSHRLPPGRAMVYAWNPLIVIEVAGSGHNDPLGLLFLVASTLAIIGGRRMLSMTALAAAALCKLFPAALLPLFAGRARWRDLLVPPALIVAAYLPYASAGPGLFRSAREYAERWRFNDSAFSVLAAAADASGVEARLKPWADARGWPSLYTQPHMLARMAAALIALGVLAVLTRRVATGRTALSRAIFCFTGTALVLLPTLHPWYLIWIAPWLCLYPSPAWIALTGLVPLSCLDAAWVRWAEYVPFYLLLVAGPARWWRSPDAPAGGTPGAAVVEWRGEEASTR